jgi:nucleoside-diphosphate-sugar epimerase
MPRVLVTGGAGYIGSVLVDSLINRKYNVTVVDNLMYKQTSLTQYCHLPNFKFVKGDVRDWNMMKPLVDETDIIIPLACIVGMPACKKYPELTQDTNQTAIEWLARNTRDDQKIIFPTTNSGYGIGQDGIHCTEETPLKPISLYGVTKVKAEEALLQRGNAVTFRLATVFGMSPRMRLDLLVNDFTYKAFKDKYIVLFESHFKRNFIHIRDVIKAFLFAIDRFDQMKGKAYNVGLSTANISKKELCEAIKQFIPDFYIAESEINEDPDKRNYIVSNAKLESLGWMPSFSLKDGIQELLKAYPIIDASNNNFTNL